METQIQKLDTDRRVKSFLSDNKILIAAVGGIALALVVASMMGNEKAKEVLQRAGATLADMGNKFVGDLGGMKDVIAPLLGKSEPQGL